MLSAPSTSAPVKKATRPSDTGETKVRPLPLRSVNRKSLKQETESFHQQIAKGTQTPAAYESLEAKSSEKANDMKTNEHISVLPVLAAAVIGSATTMVSASASDADAGTQWSALSGGRIDPVIERCGDCNYSLVASESRLMPNTGILAEAKKSEGSHRTFTAFGFVIHSNKGDQRPEWLTRDVETFGEAQYIGSWPRSDAERQPRGLRLFSWSW